MDKKIILNKKELYLFGMQLFSILCVRFLVSGKQGGRLPARACPPSLGGVAAGRVSGERLPSVARPPAPARRHCLSPPGRARAGRRLTCALGARPPTALRAAGFSSLYIVAMLHAISPTRSGNFRLC